MNPAVLVLVIGWLVVASLVYVRFLQEEAPQWEGRTGLLLGLCLMWPLVLICQPAADRVGMWLYTIRLWWFRRRAEHALRRMMRDGISAEAMTADERDLVLENIPDVIDRLLEGEDLE